MVKSERELAEEELQALRDLHDAREPEGPWYELISLDTDVPNTHPSHMRALVDIPELGVKAGDIGGRLIDCVVDMRYFSWVYPGVAVYDSCLSGSIVRAPSKSGRTWNEIVHSYLTRSILVVRGFQGGSNIIRDSFVSDCLKPTTCVRDSILLSGSNLLRHRILDNLQIGERLHLTVNSQGENLEAVAGCFQGSIPKLLARSRVVHSSSNWRDYPNPGRMLLYAAEASLLAESNRQYYDNKRIPTLVFSVGNQLRSLSMTVDGKWNKLALKLAIRLTDFVERRLGWRKIRSTPEEIRNQIHHRPDTPVKEEASWMSYCLVPAPAKSDSSDTSS